MVEKDIARSKGGGYFSLPGTLPPPDRPLPSRPPRSTPRERDRISVSTCSSTSTYIPAPSTRSSRSMRDSATIEPLLLPSKTSHASEQPNWPLPLPPAQSLSVARSNPRVLPRPDSTILPLSTPLQRPTQLERHNFHALVRSGDKVQYWIAVAMVLAGLPGRDKVPRGHWEKLTRLAEEVWVAGSETGRQEQLVTGWCFVDEPVGEDDGESI